MKKKMRKVILARSKKKSIKETRNAERTIQKEQSKSGFRSKAW